MWSKRKENAIQSLTYRFQILTSHLEWVEYKRRILSPAPLKILPYASRITVLMLPLGSPNSCTFYVHMRTYSSTIFKVKFEYLLLLPRSALQSAWWKLTLKLRRRPHTPLHHTSKSLEQGNCMHYALQRHPFSGLLHSVGELLHTP